LQAVVGVFASTKIVPALPDALGRIRWNRLCSDMCVDRCRRHHFKQYHNLRAAGLTGGPQRRRFIAYAKSTVYFGGPVRVKGVLN
jgi:hypothetical protein